MKTLPEARELAQAMVDIGKDCGRKISAVITAMDAPLGAAVGNALEVVEAIEVLQGAGPADIRQLSIELTAQILMLAKDMDKKQAKEMAATSLDDGTALGKFNQMIKAQGGIIPLSFAEANIVRPLTSPCEGYIGRINGQICGHAAHICSAANTDPLAGIIFTKKIGDYVGKGETLAYLHTNDNKTAMEAEELLKTAYSFANEKPEDMPLIYEIIT